MGLEQHMPSEKFVLPFGTVRASQDLVGGKGSSLERLTLAGLPVPPGFHITTTAYHHFIITNHLHELILTAGALANPDDPAMLAEASARIVEHFISGTIPDTIANAVSQAYTELGGEKLAVAVRSSATAEDLPETSFAGQYETYLNIQGLNKVLTAIKRCWASLWTAHAMSYRARHGRAIEEVGMAVVVQQLIPAEAAGILFTANPLTGRRDQIMLNAAWGLGEAIVSGRVTPDTIVVDKASGKIITQQIAEKELMIVCSPEGTKEEPVSPPWRHQAVLTIGHLAALRRLSLQIESLYNQPMDIEWVMLGKQFFIVQARPITRLTETDKTPVSIWQPPQSSGRYIRNGVIELLPDPLSPLFATLGLPAWNNAMRTILREMGLSSIVSHDLLITIHGYAYYNITLTRKQTARLALRLPRAVAFIFRMQRTAQQRWMQTAHPRYLAAVQRWKTGNVRELSAMQLFEGVQEILSRAAEYYTTIQCGILLAAYRTEGVFTAVYERLFKQEGDPLALTFLLGYESSPIRAEKSLIDLARWIRTQEGLSETLETMSSEQFLASYQTVPEGDENTTAWSEFRRRFAAHLVSFGYGIYTLDFSRPTLSDEPGILLDILQHFLGEHSSDISTHQAASIVKREQVTEVILARLRGIRLFLFHYLLKRAQFFAPLREDALAEIGLGWPLLRSMLHEIGERVVKAGGISSAEQVFWLTADEVRAAALELDREQLITKYQAAIQERCTFWEEANRLTPPATLPLHRKARFLGTDLNRWLPAYTSQEVDQEIKGIGASPGRASGPVRVIHGPDEFGQVQPGDILVARITTPAWTPLFALAAGIVTDIGGPLSHSSIVAREYHLPAVLGTGRATELLHTGQQVTIDGDAGTVLIAHP